MISIHGIASVVKIENLILDMRYIMSKMRSEEHTSELQSR